MSERILLVDDEPNVLSSLNRQLHRQYELSVAPGGAEGLSLIKSDGPFAVVVSDMRMPKMDGVAFLATVKNLSPQTVRIMLTGNADQETAIKAINEGSIFRFFTKPCPAENLAKGLDAALEQYRLITAERNLLEKTLAGTVKVFAEVLNLLDPEAFGKAQIRRNWVVKIAQRLNTAGAWQLSVGASLAELGNIAVPATVTSKRRRGYSPTPEEQAMIDEAPGVAKKLLGRVPRLEVVSDIIYYQNKGFDGSGYPPDELAGEELPLGARILKILNDLLSAETGDKPTAKTFELLANRGYLYDPKLFLVIQDFFLSDAAVTDLIDSRRVRDVGVDGLLPGMRTAADIKNKNGKLILSAGAEMTPAQIMILRNLCSINEVNATVKIVTPPPKRTNPT